MSHGSGANSFPWRSGLFHSTRLARRRSENPSKDFAPNLDQGGDQDLADCPSEANARMAREKESLRGSAPAESNLQTGRWLEMEKPDGQPAIGQSRIGWAPSQSRKGSSQRSSRAIWLRRSRGQCKVLVGCGVNTYGKNGTQKGGGGKCAQPSLVGFGGFKQSTPTNWSGHTMSARCSRIFSR